jgi:hypothetical protein
MLKGKLSIFRKIVEEPFYETKFEIEKIYLEKQVTRRPAKKFNKCKKTLKN